jgi:hypothetical protein
MQGIKRRSPVGTRQTMASTDLKRSKRKKAISNQQLAISQSETQTRCCHPKTTFLRPAQTQGQQEQHNRNQLGRPVMNIPDPPPIHRPLPTKLRAYEAVYWLNRSFEATLLSLERLEQLGLFRLEFLNECKIQVERTRAEVNEDLIDTLHEYEADESARFSRMGRAWQETKRRPRRRLLPCPRPQRGDQGTDQGVAARVGWQKRRPKRSVDKKVNGGPLWFGGPFLACRQSRAQGPTGSTCLHAEC